VPRLLPPALALLAIGACDSSRPTTADDVVLTDDGIAEAQANAPVSGSSLTPAQTHTVLLLLNDACAGAWCATGREYAFARIVCRSRVRACTLTVRALDGLTAYWRSCRMAGDTGFPAMIETATDGSPHLTDEFLANVDRCVAKIDASIPQP
jgi:hypothetical protein